MNPKANGWGIFNSPGSPSRERLHCSQRHPIFPYHFSVGNILKISIIYFEAKFNGIYNPSIWVMAMSLNSAWSNNEIPSQNNEKKMKKKGEEEEEGGTAVAVCGDAHCSSIIPEFLRPRQEGWRIAVSLRDHLELYIKSQIR